MPEPAVAKFQALLKTLFLSEHADLDFGILDGLPTSILHQKANAVTTGLGRLGLQNFDLKVLCSGRGHTNRNTRGFSHIGESAL